MRVAILIFYFAIAILFSSCFSDNRLKKEVFDKVELGMTVKEVKYILGEPADIKPTIDSFVNYFYYIHNNLLKKDYAVVKFDETGKVSFSFYGNPD